MATINIARERSIGELFSDLARQTSTLVRHEVALAKAELAQIAPRIGKNVGYLVLGGAVAYAALLAFAAATIIILAYVMPWWAAAILVGIVIAIVATVLISKALKALKRIELAPRQTIETLKEDVLWAKERMR